MHIAYRGRVPIAILFITTGYTSAAKSDKLAAFSMYAQKVFTNAGLVE